MSKYSLDLFQRACGASGPLHLTVEHAGATRHYVLPQPFALVGRDPRADVRVSEETVARCHLYMQVLAGRLLCLDLADGRVGQRGRYPPHSWMGQGQVHPVASASIRLVDDLSPPLTAAVSRRNDLRSVTLDIADGSSLRARYCVRHHLVLIGSASECQIRLRGVAVSRFHCALVNTSIGLWAVDLIGRSSVTLNGNVIRVARLDDGDALMVGSFTFRPRCDPGRRSGLPNEINTSGADEAPTFGPATVPGLVKSLPVAERLQISRTTPVNGIGTTDLSSAGIGQYFARIQQEIAEQFRVTMTEVVEAFREAQRDQMQVVWQELTRVRQLSEELAVLKTELSRLSKEMPTGRGQPASLPGESAVPAGSESPAVRQLAAMPADRTDLTAPKNVQRDEPDVVGSRVQQRSDQAQPISSAQGPSGSEVHAWLSRRVAAVQKEREGVWQKIRQFLGAPADGGIAAADR